jgi:uncharacterized membrane protein
MMAFLLGRVERMESTFAGMLRKRETILFAEAIGFLAINICVVSFVKGAADIITSFTATPLQITPARHKVHGLVPVILPVLMYPRSQTHADWAVESAADTLFRGHLF